jgi:hypothetical protein
VRISERIYGWLLRVYPRAHRSRYAEPMRQLFRDRLREAHTFRRVAGLWLRTLADWGVSVSREYWEAAMPRSRSRLHDQAARRCIFFARHEASSFSRREIRLEDLLLGILRQEPGLVSDVGSVVRKIEANEPASRRVAPDEDLRLSRETIRVWIAAAAIARAAGRREATPRDLAAGILRERDTFAARLLSEHLSGA